MVDDCELLEHTPKQGGRMNPWVQTAAVVAIALQCTVAWPAPLLWSWSIAEFQPDVPTGGRANSIAINPSNDDDQWVASESGGVFHSTDRGKNWSHVDAIADYQMGEIVYLPAHPSVMLATADDGFTTHGDRSGIWRSVDGGHNWTHLPHPPAPAGVAAHFSASDIAIAPDNGTVYVATSFGLYVSADSGQTWTLLNPMNGVNSRPDVYSVVALSQGIILASGEDASLVRSTDGGTTWSRAGTGPVAVYAYQEHSFGASPVDPLTVYYVDRNTHLYFSEDAGVTWAQISSAPPSTGPCGGLGFIRLAADAVSAPAATRRLRLYFGNHCSLNELIAPELGQSGHFDYGGSWVALGLDHGDTRDLAFTHGAPVTPLLLATDGGLHDTSDSGATWHFTGGGSHGYNALQVTDLKAQTITSLPRLDFYIGTQDNWIYASSDGGASWTGGTGGDEYFMGRQREVQQESDSLLTFLTCCGNVRASALFGTISAWSDAPGHRGSPSVVRPNFILQNVNGTGGIPAGLAVTHDQGATWAPFTSFPDHSTDLARTALLPEPASILSRPPGTVYYEAILAGFNPNRQQNFTSLIQVAQPWRGTPSVGYPAMNGFGGLGYQPRAAGWYMVFAVDPLNGHHLIAPDMATGTVMQSFDDANTWSEIPDLTAAISDSGHFRGSNGDYPFVQVVSFYSKDSQLTALGTFDNGVFISTDGGTHWNKVRGSEKATAVSSIEWLGPTDLLVATYGRGLWRVQGNAELPKVPTLCAVINCLLRYVNLGDPSPEAIDESVVVLDGTITGIELESHVVKGVHVSVGSLAIASVGAKAIWSSQTASPRELASLPGYAEAEAKHLLLIGLGLDRAHRLQAAIYAPSTVTASGELADTVLTTRLPTRDAARMSHRSPTANRPVLTLSQDSVVVAPAARNETMHLSFSRSPVSGTLEVLIDGEVVQRLSSVSGRTLRALVPVPRAIGTHVLVLQDARTKEVVDGRRFLVRSADRDRHGS
jgi:photosystem II stability/assembly factor-like uncharacterized protein